MISVDSLYRQVVSLSRKGDLGYSSNDDFNANLRLAQALLFDFYFDNYANFGKVPESLLPFLKESSLSIVSGKISYPADYRHRVEVQVGFVSGGATTWYPCPNLHADEEAMTLTSAVRKPSATKRRFYHALKTDGVAIFPTAFNGLAKLKYLSVPATATRNVTVDATNDVENYNSSGTVDLAWGPMEERNFVDILLYLKGIQTRQSEMLEWVAMKNQLVTKQ